jgi:hypothetical protein
MPQSQAPAQLTNVPPKPTCSPAALTIFGGGPDCQDRWNAYNQAVQQRTREELQLYVNRQKDLASAPLQQQIADLNKLVADQQGQLKKMSEQMQADALEAKSAEAAAVVQAKAAARTQGLEYGAGIGVGASLVLFAIIFGIKRAMSNFTVTKKPQAQGAAVGK